MAMKLHPYECTWRLSWGIPCKSHRAHSTLMEWASLGQGCDQPCFFTLRLEVEMDHDRGMVFHSVASDLLPARPFSGVSISHWCVWLLCIAVLLGEFRAMCTWLWKCILITSSLIFYIAHNKIGKKKKHKYLSARNKKSWAQTMPVLFKFFFYCRGVCK